jgi:transcriptional regulator with XRE-family HTH domain
MTKEVFLQEMGQRVRDLRKKAGLTQKEVAAKANIEQPTLSTFEAKGERIESADIIRRIVEATGHTMGDLFDPSEKKRHLPASRRSRAPRKKGHA